MISTWFQKYMLLFPCPQFLRIGVGTTGITSPLPPNRTGGFPAYGSPVDGSPFSRADFFSTDCVAGEQPAFGKMRVGPSLGHIPPFTPVSRVASIRSVQTHGTAHAHRARTSPACLVPLSPDTRAGSRWFSMSPFIPHPSSCRPSLQTVSRPSTLL